MSDKFFTSFSTTIVNYISWAKDIESPIAPALKPDGSGYRGHFWPMSFRYNPGAKSENGEEPTIKAIHSYMTTMDQF